MPSTRNGGSPVALITLALSACATAPSLSPLPASVVQATQSNGEPCKPLGGRSNLENAAIGAGVGAAGGAAASAALGGGSRGVRNTAIAGGVMGALAGYQFGNGIGLKEQADGSVKMDIPGAVLFRVGSAEINPSFLATLDQVAATVHDYCGVTASIVGHTDSTGSPAANYKLSKDRATAVVAYLVNKRIGNERLSADGRGADAPVDSNATEAGRAKNRRVEIFIRPPAS